MTTVFGAAPTSNVHTVHTCSGGKSVAGLSGTAPRRLPSSLPKDGCMHGLSHLTSGLRFTPVEVEVFQVKISLEAAQQTPCEGVWRSRDCWKYPGDLSKPPPHGNQVCLHAKQLIAQ